MNKSIDLNPQQDKIQGMQDALLGSFLLEDMKENYPNDYQCLIAFCKRQKWFIDAMDSMIDNVNSEEYLLLDKRCRK